jgi:hypothetical protein
MHINQSYYLTKQNLKEDNMNKISNMEDMFIWLCFPLLFTTVPKNPKPSFLHDYKPLFQS